MPLSFSPTRLRELRLRAGLSVDRLARRIDRAHTVVTRYESGEVTPSVEALARLADVLGVALDDMFDADDRDVLAV